MLLPAWCTFLLCVQCIHEVQGRAWTDSRSSLFAAHAGIFLHSPSLECKPYGESPGEVKDVSLVFLFSRAYVYVSGPDRFWTTATLLDGPWTIPLWSPPQTFTCLSRNSRSHCELHDPLALAYISRQNVTTKIRLHMPDKVNTR